MNKPAFDPTKPFDAVKPAFDPSQPFESISEAPQPKATMGQSFLAALARGASGGTLPYSVGQSGAEAEAIQKGATGPIDPESGMQMVPVESQDFLRNVRGALAEQKKTEEANPKSAFVGNVIGAVPAMAAGPVMGPALAASGMTSADMTQPTGPAQLAGETALMFGLQAAAKPVVGVAGKAFQKLLGKGQQALAEKAAARGAEKAAAETLSARSEAGRAAQNAYRQLENLRDTGVLGKLSPEAQAAADKLTSELAGKSEQNLVPAVAEKEAAAEAFKESAKTEADRAKDYAEQQLSPGEALRRLVANSKRYFIPAGLGAATSTILGFGPEAGAVGGLLFRPGLHALRRTATSPAVQNLALRGLQGGADVAAPAIEAAAPRAISRSAVRQLDPRLTALIEAQRRRQQGPQLAQNEGTP